MSQPDPHPYSPPALDFDDYEGPLAEKSLAELRAANLVLRTIQSPWMMRAGTALARAGLAIRFPGTVSALERTVFRQFCGGTNLEEATERASRLQRRGVGAILDYAVEGEDRDEELDAVIDELLRVVDAAADRPEIAFAAIKMSGVARFGLLEKIAAGAELGEDEQGERRRLLERLERLSRRAAGGGLSIFVDAEHSWIQGAIDEIVEGLMREHNRERAVVHTTVQLYLADRFEMLGRAIEDARRGGYSFGVKLVRGAYMEQESERAADRGVASPIQPSKAATDAAFDAAVTLCLENLDVTRVCTATHNVASVRHLVSEMARLGIERGDPRVTASQLLGMFDRVTFPLAAAGYNALKYIPYGGVRDAFPYLLRRADENKSVAEQLASELEAVRAELRRRGNRPL
jgi:proline dehydrogenase